MLTQETLDKLTVELGEDCTLVLSEKAYADLNNQFTGFLSEELKNHPGYQLTDFVGNGGTIKLEVRK